MPFSGTVILNCAGIGSRLGLGLTKVLMNIDGISLLEWQLMLLRDVRDLRLVVGYQANAVIAACSRIRKDVVFVYNHKYFDTRTGYSLALGARHASEYVISWDGDLLINPLDSQRCLEEKDEFVAYTDVRSQDAVLCELDSEHKVRAFAWHEHGEAKNAAYEWTGLCRVRSDRLPLKNAHVFQLLEPCLPLPGVKVEAMDIDTYEDYEKAKTLLKKWRHDIFK